MKLGKDLILTLDGTAIAASKSCKIAVSQSFIDVCSPTEARVLSKQPTTYDWSMSSDCLVATPAYADAILDMVTNGTRLLVQCYDLTLGLFRSGYAYVQNAEITGSVGSLMTLNISLVGSGPLNKLNWDNIDYILEAVTHDVDAGYQNGFDCSNMYQARIFLATKQGNQYIRYDTVRSGDDWDGTIDDDTYTRQTSFKGGTTQLYLVIGTISGNVITANSVCGINIPTIGSYPNTWFNISLSAYCEDDGHTVGDEIYVRNIMVSRAAS